MKRLILITLMAIFLSLAVINQSNAQCSICAKTTQQLGEKPAKGFNTAIIYLMLSPLAIMGYLGFKWWKGEGPVKH